MEEEEERESDQTGGNGETFGWKVGCSLRSDAQFLGGRERERERRRYYALSTFFFFFLFLSHSFDNAVIL